MALSLYAAGHVVSSVNPARSAAYATSRLARTKTDQADAALIAQFCRTQQPVSWTPPRAEVRELQARVRRVQMLQEMAQQEEHRLQSGLHSPAVRASMEAMLAVVRHEIATLQHLVQEHVDRSADVQHKQRLLCSLPGMGRWTAARVLAESDQVRASVRARPVAASAGFTPRERTSGTSVRRQARLTKTGNSRLRRALYLPAIVAMRHTPAVRALAERLQARGKRPLGIVAAAMRKLVHRLYGVLTSGTPFDPGLATAACMAVSRSGYSRRPVVVSTQKRKPGAQDLTRKTVSQQLRRRHRIGAGGASECRLRRD